MSSSVRISFAISLCAVVLIAVDAFAQDTDAAAQVQNLLNTYGPVPFTHQIPHTQNQTTCHTMPCHAPTGDMCYPGQICNTYPVTTYTPQTDTNVLAASNIQIISSTPLTFDPLAQTSLTDQLFVSGVVSYGCSTVTTGESMQLSISFVRTASIAISQSITHTQQESLSVGWKLSDQITLGGSVTVGTQASSGTIDTTSYAQTVTRSVTASIPALTYGEAVRQEIGVWPVTDTATFHATVTIDADLSPNDRGLRKLSDIFGISKRTFPITGTIAFTDASDGVVVPADVPFDSLICTNHTGIVTVPYQPTGGQRHACGCTTVSSKTGIQGWLVRRGTTEAWHRSSRVELGIHNRQP